MRVLQIIDFLPETSGGARFVVNLAIELKKKGMDVDVLLIDGKKSHFIDELEANNITVMSLGNSINRFNPLFSLKIAKYLGKYDIIHGHIFPSSYQLALARICNRNSAPIIFTEHSSYNRRASNPFFRYIERFMYNHFDIIVCLSIQVQDFLYKNLKFDKLRLPIIHNAIDVQKVYQSSAKLKTELGLLDSDFVLLMSARIAEPKNHKIIIDALKVLPEEVKLLCAGDGKLTDELKSYVILLGLNDRVKFLGSRNDVFSLMKMADVNILASNFEGLSLAALEAMSTGKPFIASNVDGLDFVVNNKEYLFENEIESLKEIILRLYEDNDFYKQCAAHTFKRSQDFDIVEMVEQYLDVYKKLIEKKDCL